MWEKFPDEIILQICDEEDIYHTAHRHVKKFWDQQVFSGRFQYFIEDNPNENVAIFHENAFKMSAYTANKAAMEYFYQKLTDAQKEVSLMEIAHLLSIKVFSCVNCSTRTDLPTEKYSDVLCYLLSQMNPEQQVELFKRHPRGILNFFLVWPWQDLFLEVAECMRDFLPHYEYPCVLWDLRHTVYISEYVKEDLLKEFFQRSQVNFKNYFIEEECEKGNFLYCLFKAEKSEIIRCIFRNIDASSKVRFVFCNQGHRICLYLIKEKKWHLLKLFIEETKLSKGARQRLKEYLELHFYAYNVEEKSRCNIRAFEQLFDVTAETDVVP